MSEPQETFVCPHCDVSGPIGTRCDAHNLFAVRKRDRDRVDGEPLGDLVADQYAVVAHIGEGGMSTVYLVWDTAHNRMAALKIMKPGLDAKLSAEARFIREAEAISSLRTPRVISCYNYGRLPDDSPYMVLELLEGPTLDVFMAKRKPDFGEIVTLFRHLLEALAAIHKGGIVHRDMKLNNVMVEYTGEKRAGLKVIDFGLARYPDSVDAPQHLTQATDVLGTVLYLGPESIKGSRTVGPAADIYAAGVTMFRIVTGRPPFNAPSAMEIVRMHCKDPVPEIVSKDGLELPESFKQFVTQCMAKDPDDRFAHGRAALRAFRSLRFKPWQNDIDLRRNWVQPD